MKKPMEVVMFKLLALRTCSPLCGDGGIEDAFQYIKMKSKHSTARSLSATIMILGLQYDFTSSSIGVTRTSILRI